LHSEYVPVNEKLRNYVLFIAILIISML
jgi:hypothetical protein